MIRRHARAWTPVLAGVLAILLPAAGAAQAQTGHAPAEPEAKRIEAAPQELEGVGITEHLNAKIPLDLEFVDENGNTVRIGDYMDGDKPVILNLVYYSCPMLCNLILNGMVDGLREVDWTPGQEFEIVSVSINPLETPKLAKLKKQNYLKSYQREGAGAGWHFLTGKEENIRVLADAVGFGYRYVEERNEYAHGAALFVLTPDGRLSRYLYGVMFEPRTLRMSLLEASEGKIGNVVDRVILYCFHYDASEGKYSLAAFRLMQVAGLATLVVLAIVLATFWHRERKKTAEGMS